MELQIKKRETRKVKALLKNGLIPGIIYGKSLKEPISIQFKKTDFIKLYKKVGSSTPITLKGDKIEQMVLIHDYQLDPVKDRLIHVDFLAIKTGEKVKANVSIVITGNEALQKKGLEFDLIIDEIEVKAIPSKLPPKIEIDISKLEDGDTVTVENLKLGDDIEIISGETEVIVTIYNPAEQKEEKDISEEENTEEENENTEKQD